MADGIFLLGNIKLPLWVIKDLFVGYISAMVLVEYFKNVKYRYVFYVGIIFMLFLFNMPWLFSIMLSNLSNKVLSNRSR